MLFISKPLGASEEQFHEWVWQCARCVIPRPAIIHHDKLDEHGNNEHDSVEGYPDVQARLAKDTTVLVVGEEEWCKRTAKEFADMFSIPAKHFSVQDIKLS